MAITLGEAAKLTGLGKTTLARAKLNLILLPNDSANNNRRGIWVYGAVRRRSGALYAIGGPISKVRNGSVIRC